MTRTEPPAPEEGPILERLAAEGYEVESLAELRHSGIRYRKAIPVLVDALNSSVEPKTLMEVVRALSVPWAKPSAVPGLIDLFAVVDDPNELGLRWAVGNALDVTWDDAYFDHLAQLARERSYGRGREMLVLGLGRSKRPEAGTLLIELLDDPTVNGHAVKALGKLTIPEARAGLEQMTGDSRTWVRKAAARALAKLD
ncbi:hypothetical protein ARHIZOSPH14_25240 [Agromyces rhizosphaerae]|uniref:HEAT repeat domain-containing protein n=1 Tax=Agromyces rhizosphaerae TaxID=88374 RepID=A0A9W6CZX4_9MICO|nr:HEAT repeat domain-containing protein [Agromyces rhizosphaerae]GLI28282.1 hypothetical protein ARHIZOSPH14_25240 [Agromyces rhizosphaerae]